MRVGGEHPLCHDAESILRHWNNQQHWENGIHMNPLWLLANTGCIIRTTVTAAVVLTQKKVGVWQLFQDLTVWQWLETSMESKGIGYKKTDVLGFCQVSRGGIDGCRAIRLGLLVRD